MLSGVVIEDAVAPVFLVVFWSALASLLSAFAAFVAAPMLLVSALAALTLTDFVADAFAAPPLLFTGEVFETGLLVFGACVLTVGLPAPVGFEAGFAASVAPTDNAKASAT